MFRREGIRGLNRGVTAVALRQMTNWGSRFGIARVTEAMMRGGDPERKLSTGEQLLASVVGGFLGCWNQPIEVIRVEMQSQLKAQDRPVNPSIWSTARYIYEKHGLRGFYRGVLPQDWTGCVLDGAHGLWRGSTEAKVWYALIHLSD